MDHVDQMLVVVTIVYANTIMQTTSDHCVCFVPDSILL